MFGLSGVIIIALALATAVGLALVITLGRFSGMIRTITRSFWCPYRERNVTAEFQEEAWDGRPVEVTHCTAFTPPTAITCEKQCLGARQLPSAKKGTSGASGSPSPWTGEREDEKGQGLRRDQRLNGTTG